MYELYDSATPLLHTLEKRVGGGGGEMHKNIHSNIVCNSQNYKQPKMSPNSNNYQQGKCISMATLNKMSNPHEHRTSKPFRKRDIKECIHYEFVHIRVQNQAKLNYMF